MKKLLLVAGIAASTMTAHAEDKLTGYAGLGWASASGNTDTSSLNLKGGLQYVTGAWQHNLDTFALRSEADDEVNGERYFVGAKSRYKFNEFDYLFGEITFDRDKFGAYEQQITETIGYGRRLINDKGQTLDVEIGAGARQSELSDDSDTNEGIIRLAGDYHLDLNENVHFNQTLKTDIGEDNTYSESVSALRAKLSNSLAANVSYTLKHNSDVPSGTENTDAYTLVSLDYGF